MLLVALLVVGPSAQGAAALGYAEIVPTIIYPMLKNRGSSLVPEPLSIINDTGITDCADTWNNGFPCPVTSHPRQDAEIGRDADYDDDSDGHAGFSFTKLDAVGNDLPASATDWSCVRDNVTQSIWGVKANEGGLHDWDDRFKWYNTNSSTNGGSAGDANEGGARCEGYDATDPSSYCNTQASVARVNAAGLCGFRDWRMPEARQLMTIVTRDRKSPSVDSEYFPYARSAGHWSSSPYADNSENAWYVHFYNSYVYDIGKTLALYVRLVRGGQ